VCTGSNIGDSRARGSFFIYVIGSFSVLVARTVIYTRSVDLCHRSRAREARTGPGYPKIYCPGNPGCPELSGTPGKPGNSGHPGPGRPARTPFDRPGRIPGTGARSGQDPGPGKAARPGQGPPPGNSGRPGFCPVCARENPGKPGTHRANRVKKRRPLQENSRSRLPPHKHTGSQ